MKTKICNKCKIEKDIDLFYKIPSCKDGHRNVCSKCCNEKNSKYQKEHHDQVLNKNRRWREKNEEYVIKQAANRYQNDKNYKKSCIQRAFIYRNSPNNKQKILQCRRTFREKHKNDPRYKTINNLRRRLIHVLKGTQKSEHTLSIIGCNTTQLVSYLQSKFKCGMSWNNYGIRGWHIDHIIPCAKFDLSKLEEQKKCFHYTNLQPLWWYENLKKGNKITV